MSAVCWCGDGVVVRFFFVGCGAFGGGVVIALDS